MLGVGESRSPVFSPGSTEPRREAGPAGRGPLKCASSSTSISATPGTGMCAAEAAGLSANR